MIAEAEAKPVLDPPVWLDHREFMVKAVRIWQEAGRFERDAGDGVDVGHVLAQGDRVLARVGCRRAEAVDIPIAERVSDRRLRIRFSET